MNYAYYVRGAWADWIASGEWNIFGTLNFAVDRKPSLQVAEQLWRAYWQLIDRHCYGRAYGAQCRLPRVVFVHSGSGGDNPHIHFLTATTTDVAEFCVLLNAIWAGLDTATADASQNEILPLLNKKASAFYLMHEDQTYQMNSFSEALTQPFDGSLVFRADALTKLGSVANKAHHLDEAAWAYEGQLAAQKKSDARMDEMRKICATLTRS